MLFCLKHSKPKRVRRGGLQQKGVLFKTQPNKERGESLRSGSPEMRSTAVGRGDVDLSCTEGHQSWDDQLTQVM